MDEPCFVVTRMESIYTLQVMMNLCHRFLFASWVKWRLQRKYNTVSNRPQWRFKVVLHRCRTHDGQFCIFYVWFFYFFKESKNGAEKMVSFFTCSSSLSKPGSHSNHNTSRPLTVHSDIPVCFALNSYCSLELVTSSRNEDQASRL